MDNNIKELRTKKSITQAELAERLGFSRSYMNRIEKGEKKPNIPLALRIAEILECTLDDIFLK